MHKPALMQLTDRLRSEADARIALYENQLERLCGSCKAYPVRSILPRKTIEVWEQEILQCVNCNKSKEANGAFQKLYCAQWKNEEGAMVPPKQ